MVVTAKRPRTFEVVFHDPNKRFYCSGDKVSGNVVVEASEAMSVSAIRVFGVGCAKVAYNKGKQKCRKEVEYLKYEEEVHLDKRGKERGLFSHPFLWRLVVCGPE